MTQAETRDSDSDIPTQAIITIMNSGKETVIDATAYNSLLLTSSFHKGVPGANRPLVAHEILSSLRFKAKAGTKSSDQK